MLNKPKFMKPSTNKEECTIDVTPLYEDTGAGVPFSCIVDGNESIKAWEIVIYDIIDDDKVYDTGRVDLTTPFYPVDEKNRNVVFSVDLKQHSSTITNSFINRAEAYYWTITFWGSSDNSVTSYQEVFYANTTPSLSFSYKYPTRENYETLNAETVLKSKGCTFKAEYTQAEGVQLKRYGWKITDTDNGQVLVDTITKNQIYGSADNIVCKYDGFLNGGSYSVELYVETQNNTKITSSFEISVSYATTFLSNDFNVETLKNEPAIMLDWSKALVIAGILKDTNNEDNVVSVDDTTFKTNYPVNNQCSIEIPDKFKVVYDDDASLNFDIDENSYIAFSTQMLSDKKSTLFFAEGLAEKKDEDGYYTASRELLYENGVFSYNIKHDGLIVASDSHAVANRPSEYVWYNIFMSPLVKTEGGEYSVELNIYEGNVVDCVYPSEDLYPNEDFYPTFGNWDNLKKGV